MIQCADLIVRILRAVKPSSDSDYELEESELTGFRQEVLEICKRHPIVDYPVIGD